MPRPADSGGVAANQRLPVTAQLTGLSWMRGVMVMDHVRVLRVVLGVTAGYLILLAVWLGWVVQHTPDGTVPFQIMALVGIFGSGIGIGLMWVERPSKADRRLARHGIEGGLGWSMCGRWRGPIITVS